MKQNITVIEAAHLMVSKKQRENVPVRKQEGVGAALHYKGILAVTDFNQPSLTSWCLPLIMPLKFELINGLI